MEWLLESKSYILSHSTPTATSSQHSRLTWSRSHWKCCCLSLHQNWVTRKSQQVWLLAGHCLQLLRVPTRCSKSPFHRNPLAWSRTMKTQMRSNSMEASMSMDNPFWLISLWSTLKVTRTTNLFKLSILKRNQMTKLIQLQMKTVRKS